MHKELRLSLVAAAGLLFLAACGVQPPPAETSTLTVTVVGNGTVSSNTIGISQTGPGSDDHAFTDGTEVTLTAVADTGWTFAGWDHADCADPADPCVVTVDADMTVTATFTEDAPPGEPVTLTVNVVAGGSAAGSVTSAPAGIDTDGGVTDSADFDENTVVTLTAAATVGAFAGWTGGDCDGLFTLTCDVTMNEGEAAVTANFNDVSTLTVRIEAQADSSEEFLTASQDDPPQSEIDWPAGFNYQSSSDLDLGFDLTHEVQQHVGLRFDLTSAALLGTRIESAVIEFTAISAGSGDVNVSIWADAADAPINLAADALENPSFNLSLRDSTAATVAWAITDAWAVDEAYETPDLGGIMQELVDNGDWDGTAVFVLSPTDDPSVTNTRRAVPEGASDGPAITINYVTIPLPPVLR